VYLVGWGTVVVDSVGWRIAGWDRVDWDRVDWDKVDPSILGLDMVDWGTVGLGTVQETVDWNKEGVGFRLVEWDKEEVRLFQFDLEPHLVSP